MGSVNKRGTYIDAYIEIGVIVALITVVALFLFLRWTKTGRSFYAVGGNRQSALMLGINVKRTTFLAYLMCGILGGIGGFVYFMHAGSGSASHATGAEMNAIASSIIGGTMLTGGVGNIIGTFFGVLLRKTASTLLSSTASRMRSRSTMLRNSFRTRSIIFSFQLPIQPAGIQFSRTQRLPE